MFVSIAKTHTADLIQVWLCRSKGLQSTLLLNLFFIISYTLGESLKEEEVRKCNFTGQQILNRTSENVYARISSNYIRKL